MDRSELDDAIRTAADSTAVLHEVAHILQAPLGSIMMLAEVLRERGTELSDERHERQLRIIHMAALGLATLAGDLLRLVDPPAGTGRTESFRLGDTLEAVAHIVRPVTEFHDSDLVVVAPEGVSFVGPAALLSRALLGLALRLAMRIRDGTMEIRAAVTDADFVTFSVMATGTGLEEAETDRLFEIFNVDTASNSYTLSSEGLGMTATAHLIRALGSSLEVTTGCDDEATFSFGVRFPHAVS